MKYKERTLRKWSSLPTKLNLNSAHKPVHYASLAGIILANLKGHQVQNTQENIKKRIHDVRTSAKSYEYDARYNVYDDVDL